MSPRTPESGGTGKSGNGSGSRSRKNSRYLRNDGNLQVRRVRRIRGVSRWFGFLILVSVAAAGTAAAAKVGWERLSRSPRFQIVRIEIEGNRNLSRAEIEASLQLEAESNLLATNVGALRRKVETLSWVRKAEVGRDLPGTLKIRIEERTPVVLANRNGGLYLADSEGVLMDEFGPRYFIYDLPVVTGLEGDESDTERIRSGAQVVVSLTAWELEEITEKISEIDATQPENLKVVLEDDPAEVILGRDDFPRKLAQLMEVKSRIRSRYAQVDYYDLRFDGQLVFRPVDRSDGPGDEKK